MGYVIKHSTSNVNKSRRKGNVAIGVDSSGYDKTSVSGFYAGVPPVEGKHNFVQTSASGTPNFYCVDDTELINFANSIGGSVLTVLEAKNHLLQQNDIIFTDNLPKNKLTDGLRLNLNARIESSFLDNKPTDNLFGTTAMEFKDDAGIYTNDIISGTDSLGDYFIKDVNNAPWWSGLRIYNNNVRPLTAGVSYVLSFECRSGQTGWSWAYDSNASGGGWSGNDQGRLSNTNLTFDSTGGTVYTSDMANTWQRVSYRVTMKDSSVFTGATAYPHDSFFTNTNNVQIYYRNAQLEVGREEATDYSSGTRSQNTTWYDLSGYGNNFTPMVSMSFTGHSFDFNGVDSGVQDHISSYNPDGADSVLECLFKPMDLSQEQAIFSDNYGPEYGFWIHTNGKLRAVAYASMYADLEIGKWYHAVMNIDPGATKSSTDQTYVQLYLNGEYIGQSNANTGNGMNDQPFTLGYDYRSGSPTRYFSGSIAAASVYYGQFNQSEVSQNYYGGDIVTDGLVLAVDAGNLVSYESGSTTAYSMTGSLSGSLENGVSYSDLNGGNFSFDGTNDQINFGDESSLDFTNGVFSMETWINIPSSWTGGSQYPNLISKGAKAGWDTDGWSLFCFRDYGGGTGYTVGVGLRNSGTTNVRVSYNQPTETWLHVVGTLDGSSIKVYVNGELKTSNTQTINPASNNYSVLLGRDTSGNSFPGEIAISRLYNKTLTPSEVLQNYNAQKARFI